MNTGFYPSQIVQKKQTPKNVSSAKHQSTNVNNILTNIITQPVVSLTPFTKKMIAQPPVLPFLILPRISCAEKNSDYLNYATSYPGQMDVTYNNILESNKTSQHEQSDISAIGENGYELIDLCSSSSETDSIAPIDEVEEVVSDGDVMFEEIDIEEFNHDDLDIIGEEHDAIWIAN